MMRVLFLCAGVGKWQYYSLISVSFFFNPSEDRDPTAVGGSKSNRCTG
jgi:hypothetical protein